MKKISIKALVILQILLIVGFILVFVGAMPISLKLSEEITMPRHLNGEQYTISVKSPAFTSAGNVNNLYLTLSMRNTAMAFAAQQGKDATLNYDFVKLSKDYAYYRINSKDGVVMNVAISTVNKNNPKIIAWEAVK